MVEINQEGQNSKIEEKRREGTCKFCCDRDSIESEEKSNNVQIDLPRISAIVKKDDLVARDAHPKEIVEWLYKSNYKETKEVDDFKVKEKYVDDIFKGFTMSKAKSYKSNIQDKLKLTKDDTHDFVDTTYFRKLVESLRYLTSTRLDITYGVGLISRFMKTPRQSHLQAAKRTLRYIQGTQTDGIFYSKTNDSSLVGFTDSDWAGDTIQRKSTSGYAFYLGSGVFSWSSKKQ
ncbi:uncharacterized mitochondrial protein AtMg00810-like [Nicotiana tomentosiformis]|uniref:uncharacterized mitochondrial protein AtMg00810-like n=1 Tax=Nicotiana tomentosiformis TaxID=4098 RepID=UPI00388CA352